MKKRLLTLGTLALAMSMNAQNAAFYVGSGGYVRVETDALLYSGGDVKIWHMPTMIQGSGWWNAEPISDRFDEGNMDTWSGMSYTPISNFGMIKIEGDYKKVGIPNGYVKAENQFRHDVVVYEFTHSNFSTSLYYDGARRGLGNYNVGYGSAYAGARRKAGVSTKESYGQLIILGSKGDTDGHVFMLPTYDTDALKNSFLDENQKDRGFFPVSLPFKGELFKNWGKFFLNLTSRYDGSDFYWGDGQEGRYTTFLMKWNNKDIVYDGLKRDSQMEMGASYSLNAGRDVIGTGIERARFLGVPTPTAFTTRAKGVIAGHTDEQFSNLGYNDWKAKTNAYGEDYISYLGDANTNSKVYNKNQYRFGNPYTSNVDISGIEGNTAWVTIKNKNLNLNIKEASRQLYIKNFTVQKPNLGLFDAGWNSQVGAVEKKYIYYTAVYNGTEWTGNAEALILRPMETFSFNFPILDPTKLGSRIIDVEVNLNDNHKTFEHIPTAYRTQAPSSSLSKMGVNNTLSRTARNTTVSNANDFYQLEISLVKDDVLADAPVYLVGTNYNKESGTNAESNAKIFVYGIKEDEVALTSKKAMNDFNSVSYVAKPLGLGLNQLENGKTYELKFNLYEASIFNKVKELNGGAFYIKDKETNKITEISAETSIRFTAGENLSERFVLYWKQVPETEKVVEVVEVPKTVVTPSAQSTIVYKEGLTNKVRFENNLGKARVEVYDLAGRLISASSDINTAADHTLTLGVKGVYIVKVSYENGEVRTQKLINE